MLCRGRAFAGNLDQMTSKSINAKGHFKKRPKGDEGISNVAIVGKKKNECQWSRVEGQVRSGQQGSAWLKAGSLREGIWRLVREVTGIMLFCTTHLLYSKCFSRTYL